MEANSKANDALYISVDKIRSIRENAAYKKIDYILY